MEWMASLIRSLMYQNSNIGTFRNPEYLTICRNIGVGVQQKNKITKLWLLENTKKKPWKSRLISITRQRLDRNQGFTSLSITDKTIDKLN
jgi:hypothetical protein